MGFLIIMNIQKFKIMYFKNLSQKLDCALLRAPKVGEKNPN